MTNRERRRARRGHRDSARYLINGGTFLNRKAPIGSTPWMVAKWHLKKARTL